MRRLRLHAIAILSICCVILLLFKVAGPKPPEQVDPDSLSPKKIIITSAHWGWNCKADVDKAVANREKMVTKRDKKGNVIEEKLIQPVARDNIKKKLESMCNGKRECEFQATSETFELEPLEACYKKFEATYRCFDFDKLRIVNLDQGEKVTLTCKDEQKAPDAAQKPAP